jgi:hypothetical protein
LVSKLDSAGLCKQTKPAPAKPPTVVDGRTLSGAWLCVTRGPGSHTVVAWSENSHGQAHRVAEAMAKQIRNICTQVTSNRQSGAIVATSSVPLIEGATWLAVAESRASARAALKVLGGTERDLGCQATPG